MASVVKITNRHRRTAAQFQRWLERNPNASLTRQFGAFNAIADSEYREIKMRREAEKEQKVEKAKRKREPKRI